MLLATWRCERKRSLRAPDDQRPIGSNRPSRLSELLRKEVIQPQVPLRLPCYDFTPITNPTLDVCLSPPERDEFARRLQVSPAFVV